ncbi:MAG: hypothetical protein AAAB20_07855 [Rhizobium sp.]|uniref:hypothetical protein n=1 Tax=Rhizobium sp. TaxID=391 RepID=UPI0030F210B9
MAETKHARLIAAAQDLLDAVLKTRALVAEAALTGFNYADGDWAERLFENQAVLSAAISKAEPHHPHTAEKVTQGGKSDE